MDETIESVARIISPEAFNTRIQWMDRLYLSEQDADEEVERWGSARETARRRAQEAVALVQAALREPT
jgi:hypothetical protein